MIASNGEFSERPASALIKGCASALIKGCARPKLKNVSYPKRVTNSIVNSCARKKLNSAEKSRVCLLKLVQRVAPRLRQKHDASS